MLPFTKDYRLRKPSDFRAVRESGRSWPSRLVVIWANSNATETTRMGVSVGKRIGNAVVRNLVKRRLREAIRGIPLPVGYDVVVMARAPAASATYKELEEAIKKASRKIGGT
jgi:ribonuclease P protein component